ncbi:MAG: aerobic carbon-monoxide dehydrogenase small subunit [Solirubrobacteraceae bacterium]|jgi:carbon-monoxide dehydrogenase small subunit|nr:aerobic carbon-monoxide dehydrogenase small subunit [Solirubrobacteraceae bacterium]
MKVAMTVNGVGYERDVDPRLLLVDFLREQLDLVGTHIGCEHGVCGTCTVLMNGESIRSCIMFAVQAEGADITTVEGLIGDGEMHPLQEAFWEKQGLQCGYCTPGMLLRAHEILTENPDPSREEVKEAISSNLCRCTGYAFIIDSILDAAQRMREAGHAPAPGDDQQPATDVPEVPERVPGGEEAHA